MELPTIKILLNLQGARQRGGLDKVEYGKCFASLNFVAN